MEFLDSVGVYPFLDPAEDGWEVGRCPDDLVYASSAMSSLWIKTANEKMDMIDIQEHGRGFRDS